MNKTSRTTNSLTDTQKYLLLEYVTDNTRTQALDGKTAEEVTVIAVEALGFHITTNNVHSVRRLAEALGRPVWKVTRKSPTGGTKDRLLKLEDRMAALEEMVLK